MHKTIARLEDTSHGTLLTLKHTQCFDKSKILGTNARVTALPETVTNAKQFHKHRRLHLFRTYFCTIIKFWTVDSDLGESQGHLDGWNNICQDSGTNICQTFAVTANRHWLVPTRKSCTIFLKLFASTLIFDDDVDEDDQVFVGRRGLRQ